jgi:hypothetical protein
MVLGMHRSGTSALTRALNLLGTALPRNVMAANHGNVKGYWEPVPIVLMNDALLAEAGSWWADWRHVELATLPPERIAHYKAEIARIVAEEYADERLFVVKDPRICRLMPIWHPALDDIAVETCFAIPVRHPVEVARSLEGLHDLSLPLGCLTWLRHVLDAERATRGHPRVFVHYHELLSEPSLIAARVGPLIRPIWPPDDSSMRFAPPSTQRQSRWRRSSRPASSELPNRKHGLRRWSATLQRRRRMRPSCAKLLSHAGAR